MDKVIYKQTNIGIPYPRIEWECECGFKLLLIRGYNMDYRDKDYGKLINPKGKCMKCSGEITT